MKYITKRRYAILFGVFYATPIILYSLKIIDEKALVAALASIATIYYGTLKLQIENDILFKELFISFNERYGAETNDLFNELRQDPSQGLGPTERNIVIDYFNLCAEEYLWKTKGRIPKDVWIAWRAGIVENLRIPQVKQVFQDETTSEAGKTSYYGLYKELLKYL